MRTPSTLIAFSFTIGISIAQPSVTRDIEKSTANAMEPVHYLASDELKGRGNMRPEIHQAADYISKRFASGGAKKVNNAADYFQAFQINVWRPATQGALTLNNTKFQIGTNAVQARGTNLDANAPMVYIGYGHHADWEKAEVKGKIVFAEVAPDSSASVIQELRKLDERQKIASDKGALALVIRFRTGDVPWDVVVHAFTNERILKDKTITTPVYLINEQLVNKVLFSEGDKKSQVSVTTNKFIDLNAKNVVAVVEGSDPKLKGEYVALTAHYDHLGVAHHATNEGEKVDSIYNGARDNAVGVAAVIAAAKYFAKNPPKRSMLFIAYTAEEMGLGGSKYFSENPLIPLKQIVYNLNIDNGGYNDTTRVTLVGLGRTSADDDIKKACSAFGLTTATDPAPEQMLFDRSDNVSLAVKGIPAPTFGMGMASFDETIKKYYHQPNDEVATMDLKYMMKYVRAYILAAKNIADNPVQPMWTSGDKYEAAWKTLYGK